MDGALRYSEQRLRDSFTANVLFSEPLKAESAEVWAAAAEDAPELDWPCWSDLGLPIDTTGVSMATGHETPDAGAVLITGVPGPLGLTSDQIEPVVHRSQLITGVEAAQAMFRDHTDHLSISTSSKDDGVASRFAAARRMACMAGVFAGLPTCLGVYFPSADLVLSPQRWRDGIETARRGKLPFFDWVSLDFRPVRAPDGATLWTGETIGLAAFLGRELSAPALPSQRDAAHVLTMTAAMLVESDHVFTDGDTMGVEGGDVKWRIRHAAEAPGGPQTDLWVLLHPDAPIDEMAVFGERSRPAPPPGQDNGRRGDWGALRSGLAALTGRTTH